MLRGRAALKSDRACDQADDFLETAAHFGQEGRTGAITGAWLATNPGPRFPLDGTTENAQNGGGDGMADATTVFGSADIQWVKVGPPQRRDERRGRFGKG